MMKFGKNVRAELENQVKNQGNTLKDSTVEEIVCKVFKENIKDITTAAAKEKETTADADNDANNSPTTLTVCDDFGRPQAPLYPIRPWRELRTDWSKKRPGSKQPACTAATVHY
ncbi:MAG: hypothetical protein ACLUE2_16485 [Bacteroides cellulosilyticus]